MLDNEPTQDKTTESTQTSTEAAPKRRTRRATRSAGPPSANTTGSDQPAESPQEPTPDTAPKRARRSRKTAAPSGGTSADPATGRDAANAGPAPAQASADTAEAEAQPAPRQRRTKKAATGRKGADRAPTRGPVASTESAGDAAAAAPAAPPTAGQQPTIAISFQEPSLLFREPTAATEVAGEPEGGRRRSRQDDDEAVGDQRPAAKRTSRTAKAGAATQRRQAATADSAGVTKAEQPKRRRRSAAQAEPAPAEAASAEDSAADVPSTAQPGEGADEADESGDARRRRRRRGGRGRRRDGAGDADKVAVAETEEAGEPREDQPDQAEDEAQPGTSRRRRRRRRRADSSDEASLAPDDPERTVVKIREPRQKDGETDVALVKGSTRLEAKKQRRREGREAGRRRAPVITEAEFLARREAVDRVMVVREIGDRTQIAVLEDGVLVEHYVNRETHTSLVGNVYLGKVQNVLPSMEAAFVDIGRGRNAVLYAGEVNFDVAGLEGQPKRIENALKSGQSVLVQVTKDPIAHKGARLTSQISLPGRYLVYVPEGSMTGISRKLPDTERNRLKNLLRSFLPEDAGVIVRTAAEGATEDELKRDVNRLSAQWEDIERKAGTASAPALLYGEPDLTIRVIRDIFNEDFSKLVVSGEAAWDTVDAYVRHVAPDLVPRLQKWTDAEDAFAAYRIDEQIVKALDRKVWLPSGGSLVIDRTEAMTVIDVNTGKFTGQGGNLEETVTKNNLEAAEEIVRQLRLRDIGGIIVIDFIDMVLESNRELVLRRLLECLGRDRTKHQVAEITSLGLVQMTRKRVGQGLLEAFSEPCEQCNGRGIKIHLELLEPKQEGGRRRRARSDAVQPAAEQVDGSGDRDEAASAIATEALATAEEPAPAESGRASFEGSAREEAETSAASLASAAAGESGRASPEGSAPGPADTSASSATPAGAVETGAESLPGSALEESEAFATSDELPVPDGADRKDEMAAAIQGSAEPVDGSAEPVDGSAEPVDGSARVAGVPVSAVESAIQDGMRFRQPIGLGSVPDQEAHPSHPDARPVAVGWPG
jgi:ribonuclease E